MSKHVNLVKLLYVHKKEKHLVTNRNFREMQFTYLIELNYKWTGPY